MRRGIWRLGGECEPEVLHVELLLQALVDLQLGGARSAAGRYVLAPSAQVLGKVQRGGGDLQVRLRHLALVHERVSALLHPIHQVLAHFCHLALVAEQHILHRQLGRAQHPEALEVHRGHEGALQTIQLQFEVLLRPQPVLARRLGRVLVRAVEDPVVVQSHPVLDVVRHVHVPLAPIDAAPALRATVHCELLRYRYGLAEPGLEYLIHHHHRVRHSRVQELPADVAYLAVLGPALLWGDFPLLGCLVHPQHPVLP
mmetsp:Transcript_1111/g.2463  ORF Transcript_1111/g.2463 Transcript_1111/m.2463 type:complete len:256 (+) Transcript_1111:3975-4742(+)